MNLILDNAHFDLITLSLAAVFLLTIKNKIINVILSLSKKQIQFMMNFYFIQ